jgi:enamine deaminase RidA (YjgF/YER057c/UK114 family)
MSAGQFLRLEYVTPSEAQWDNRQGVLGAAAFEGGAGAVADGAVDFPLAHVHTPVLTETRGIMEVWRAGEPTQPGSHGRVRFARGGDFLFGSVALQEAALTSPAGPDPRTPLEIATDLAYRDMYAVLAAAGNPHLVRVWNYIPDINLDTHGLERYRQFNTGRHEALRASGSAVTGSVPAASALGGASGSPLTIYFLASRRAPAFIENPRQMSAYRYPSQYGPRSPAFSRATVLGEGSEATLFVSGTASIVGHRTLHTGDPAAQTRETLVNIEALLQEAARRSGIGALRLQTLAYKVYVRDPQDLPVIRAELESAVGRGAALLYLKADICRRDLAVEIEAVGGGGWRHDGAG